MVEESGAHADLPILAARLVAEAGSFGETVKVALLSLPFAIEWSQSFLETFCAKPVRVPIDVRVPASPCSIASYALIHHKPFLLHVVHRKMTYLASYEGAMFVPAVSVCVLPGLTAAPADRRQKHERFFHSGYVSFTSACQANRLHLTIKSELDG